MNNKDNKGHNYNFPQNSKVWQTYFCLLFFGGGGGCKPIRLESLLQHNWFKWRTSVWHLWSRKFRQLETRVVSKDEVIWQPVVDMAESLKVAGNKAWWQTGVTRDGTPTLPAGDLKNKANRTGSCQCRNVVSIEVCLSSACRCSWQTYWYID